MRDLEPLVDDDRLERAVAPARKRWHVPDNVEFVTFIEETAQGPLACFVAISPHPKHPAYAKLRTKASVPLSTWVTKETQKAHYVGVSDQLVPIINLVAKEHAEKVASAKELMD